jgi:ABC-type nitrate/sulfonate/bicarbonate transport system substrate-binding protein
MVRRACLTLLAVLLTLSAAGCGSTPSDSRPDEDARLMLDSAPNAIHSGLYLTIERGYDEAEGVNLQIEEPGDGATAVKALHTGQVEMAFVDIHDLAIADAKGQDLVGVMALAETPLGAVLVGDGRTIRRPKDLEGRKVGVGAAPADRAILDSIVRGDGGDPAKVDRVPIGARAAVGSVVSGKVAAAIGSWNADGVALADRRKGTRQFLEDDFGAPSYPEIVLAVTRETLETDKPVVQAAIRALRRGYEIAMTDPDSAVSSLTDQEPTLDRTLQSDELEAVSPSLMGGADYFGQLQPGVLAKWATWEQKLGIVAKKPDVAAMFDTSVAKSGLKQDPDAG